MTQNHNTDWILVAEDQLDLWIILQANLKRVLPQVPLIHVGDGILALKYLQDCLLKQQLLPRLILSNLYMPRLEDGLQLLTTLKDASSNYCHLPVLVISSSTAPSDHQVVNQKGGSFLPKPVTVSEWSHFLSTIQQHWQESASLA